MCVDGCLLVLTFIIIVLSFLIWNACSRKVENFAQPTWTETLKCLNLDNDDLNRIHADLLKGEDHQIMLTKIVNMASNKKENNKKLTDDEIFGCLMGAPQETKEEFTPRNPYFQTYAPVI